MTYRNFNKPHAFILLFFITFLNCIEAKASTFYSCIDKCDTVSNSRFIKKLAKFKIDYNCLSVCISAFQNKSFESQGTFTLGVAEKYSLNFQYLGDELDWKFNGKSELGFVYIVDSLWTKSSDYLEMYLIGVEKHNKLVEMSYSFLLVSQVLPTYNYSTSVDKSIRKNQVGGFLNPLVLQLAYGFNYNYNDIVRITSSFATLRLQSYKKFWYSDQGNAENRNMVTLDYGFSLVLELKKSLAKQLDFTFNTNFFANSLDKDNVKCNSDFNFTYQVARFIALQFSSRFKYDTSYSNKINYQNEMLFSFSYKFGN